MQSPPSESVHDHLHTFFASDRTITVPVKAHILAEVEQLFGFMTGPVITCSVKHQLKFFPAYAAVTIFIYFPDHLLHFRDSVLIDLLTTSHNRPENLEFSTYFDWLVSESL